MTFVGPRDFPWKSPDRRGALQVRRRIAPAWRANRSQRNLRDHPLTTGVPRARSSVFRLLPMRHRPAHGSHSKSGMSSALQRPANPRERWLCGVNADDRPAPSVGRAGIAPAAERDRSGAYAEVRASGPRGQASHGRWPVRQRLPIRHMAGLLHLKNGFKLGDPAMVQRWRENACMQYFCGLAHFEPRLPCDATQIGRFRRVIVDSAVQEKAIAHTTDSGFPRPIPLTGRESRWPLVGSQGMRLGAAAA